MFQVLFLFSTLLVAAFAAPTSDYGFQLHKFERMNAKVGEFPYMVSLKNSDDSFFCGGSILNSRTIITAACCVEGFHPDNVTIVVGSTHLNSGGTRYKISKITMHPDYCGTTKTNDIAVLITSKAITPSSSVGFISLPSSSSSIGAGVKVTLTGWGETLPGKDSETKNTLQKIPLSTISEEDCKNKVPACFNAILNTNICTLTKAGGRSCKGDLGGPLTIGHVLVGIVSRKKPCAQNYPDVYTRVSSYVSWINDNTQS